MAETVSGQLLSTLNPLAYSLGILKVDKLPKLTKDDDTNKLIYNTLGSIVSVGGASALLTAIAHRRYKRKWEKANKKIIKSKVNSLYPLSYPDYATDDSGEQARLRELGLVKTAGGENEKEEKTIGEHVMQAIKGSLPIIAATTAGVAISDPVHKLLEDQTKRELDVEITRLRNELNSLQAKAIELGIEKKADDPPANPPANPDSWTAAGALALGTGIAVGSPIVALAVYKYLHKHDQNYKRIKALESLASENLTNIPQRLSLHLTSEGLPVAAREEKVKALERLEKEVAKAGEKQSKLVNELPKGLEEPKEDVVDFDDKVTKLKKEDLFA